MRPSWSERPVWQTYGVAFALILAALLFRKLLDPYTTDAVPLDSMYVAVTIAVWFGGWRPAVLVMAVGYVASLWWFYPPSRSWKLWSEFGFVRTLLYLLSCGVTIFLCESMRRARRHHAASEQKLMALVNHMDEPFCSIGPGTRLTYLNPSAEKYLGLAQSLASGRTWNELMPQVGGSAFEARLQSVLRDQQPARFESDQVVPGRWTAVTVTASAEGATVLLRDITEEKLRLQQLEQEVARRTAELRETIADLESFSYTLVHDMRAPVRSIRHFVSLIIPENGGEMSSDTLDHLTRIDQTAARMDRLILDVLHYSRLTRTNAELQDVDLNEVMREVVAYPTFAAEKADMEIDDNLPAVRGNKALLCQCFLNLVQNAMKFVAPGVKPRIRVFADAAADRVRVTVADNGIGIMPDAKERIFEPFQREDSHYEGTGIGLAIVRKVIEQLQGQVGVDSEPGMGSRFWLEIPAAQRPVAGGTKPVVAVQS
ncbi:MAG: ATP-binding protein [Opitutaceae bacterium]|nr:ATP-binding protein [Opitutaceae bacterium]